MKNKNKGFTLVELVIVIAIVIVLSVVSVPIYRSYTTKAKMAEGYALLGVIMSAQKAYFSEYGNFYYAGRDFTGVSTVLGIDATANKYFTLFNPSTHAVPATGFRAWVRKPEEVRDINSKEYLVFEFFPGGITGNQNIKSRFLESDHDFSAD